MVGGVRRQARAVGLVIALAAPGAAMLAALGAAFYWFASASRNHWHSGALLFDQLGAATLSAVAATAIATLASSAIAFGLALHDLAAMPMFRHIRTSRRFVAWAFPFAALAAGPMVTVCLVPALWVTWRAGRPRSELRSMRARRRRSRVLQGGLLLVAPFVAVVYALPFLSWSAFAIAWVPGFAFSMTVWVSSWTLGRRVHASRFQSFAWPLVARAIRDSSRPLGFATLATVGSIGFALLLGAMSADGETVIGGRPSEHVVLQGTAPLGILAVIGVGFIVYRVMHASKQVTKWVENRQTDRDHWAHGIHITERSPAFVLFLRSHREEHWGRFATPADMSNWFTDCLAPLVLQSERANGTQLSLAEYMHGLSEIPVICLGVPENAGDRPMEVPAEVRVDAEGWEEHVTSLMHKASAIVAITGSTAGVRYEVDVLLQHFTEKSLIMDPLPSPDAFQVVSSPGPHLYSGDRLEDGEATFHRVGAQVVAISDRTQTAAARSEATRLAG